MGLCSYQNGRIAPVYVRRPLPAGHVASDTTGSWDISVRYPLSPRPHPICGLSRIVFEGEDSTVQTASYHERPYDAPGSYHDPPEE